MDREKVIKGLESCVISMTKCFFNRNEMCPYASVDVCHCEQELMRDALALLKEQEDMGKELTDAIELIHKKNERIEKLLKEKEAVKPRYAEMLIIHNGGAEEYVKDIESIVLLAHKDYDIVYCGTFGKGGEVKC